MSSPRPVLVNDGNPALQFIGPWFTVNTQNLTGSFASPLQTKLKGINTNGNLTFDFSGTAVSVFASNGPYGINSTTQYPTVQCFLDGSNDESIIYTYPGHGQISSDTNWVACIAKSIADGPHTLTVAVTVRNLQTFWFNLIQYTPSSTVPVSQAIQRIDSTDAAISYSPEWHKLDDQPDDYTLLFGTTYYTHLTGQWLEFSFIGSSIACYGIMGLDISGVLILTAQATYAIDSAIDKNGPLPFTVGQGSLRNSSGMLLFETVLSPSPSNHTMKILFLGNGSTAPLAITYFIINAPLARTGSFSGAIHRKPVIGGIIGGLVLISLLLNIWPSYVL